MSEYPAHLEIEPHVHLVRGENRARFPEANSLLIDDEVLTLVDAGSSMHNLEITLKDLDYQVDDVERVILTHFHIDHKGHASHIQDVSGCEVICHPLAETGVKTFEGMVEFYGIGGHQFYDDWRALLDSRFNHVLTSYRVTGNFTDGKVINCGETDLIPIHLPGHTIDHTCFGINGLETILLVDIDLTRFGPWYGNEVSDIDTFKESIQQVIDLEPKMGISSHLMNPVIEELDERLQTYLSIFDKRENQILDNLTIGYDTIEKLSKKPTIYPRIPIDAYLVFEQFMLEKHIELMIKNGLVREEDGQIFIERG
ncbi:MAG: MBL fold metallo-hydrolase [Candidatus Thorarchaeota archaeon]|jgi:glyoxylase-like metal-dependent hydrolase (beta-lactamase superfamily II)